MRNKLRGCLCLLEVRVTILVSLLFCLRITIWASLNSLIGFATTPSSFRLVENCRGSFQPKESQIITPPEESGIFWRHVTRGGRGEAVNSSLDNC